MTKEQEPVADAAHEETKEAAVSSEKQENASAETANPVDLRDEQDRRVIIFASLLLLLLVAPMFLPVERDRSLWRMTRYDSTGRFILLGIFGWPVFSSIAAFIRGLQKKVPGKVFLGVATTLTSLQTLAGTALVTMVLLFGRGNERSFPVWLGAIAALLAIGMVVRSFFRTSWQRWQHLIAALALLAVMVVLILAGVEGGRIDRTSSGGWVFLFGTAALVPFIGTTVVSRRH